MTKFTERSKNEHWLNYDGDDYETSEIIALHSCDCQLAIVEQLEIVVELLKSTTPPTIRGPDTDEWVSNSKDFSALLKKFFDT